MKDYGTNVVAGVTPGKEGQNVDGIPVFHTVKRAVEQFEVDATLLVVPPKFACASIHEALDAGIRKIVVTAEGIPLQDALEIRKTAKLLGHSYRNLSYVSPRNYLLSLLRLVSILLFFHQ